MKDGTYEHLKQMAAFERRYGDHVTSENYDRAANLIEQLESQLAAAREREKQLTERAERAEKLLAGKRIYWPHEADGDQGSDDLDAICDGYEVGQTFSVQVALQLPDEYYVVQVNNKNQNDPRPATDEEIAELKAERKAERERRQAEWDRINAERYKPVKAVPIEQARKEASDGTH